MNITGKQIKKMKATLTFNLDDPEDKIAHYRCVKALDMAIALSEIISIRKGIENRIEFQSLDQWSTLDAVLDKISEIYDDNDIKTDDLIR